MGQLLCGLFGMICFAADVEDFDPHYWDRLFRGLMITLSHGALGIALGALGFKIFDWITPKIDVEKELAEKHNIAVAIVCAAMILGICYIAANV